MSGSNSNTGQAPLAPGDKVKLTEAIVGTIENDVVFNNKDDDSNRKDHPLPAQTEVFIRKILPRSLLNASTGGGASANAIDYSFETILDQRSFQLVLDTETVITEFRIPHTYLSKTRGGQPDRSHAYADKAHLYLIKDFSYKIQGKTKTLSTHDIIQVWGKATTKTGGEVRRNTAHLSSAMYPFRLTTSDNVKRRVCWRSKHYHPASAFERV